MSKVTITVRDNDDGELDLGVEFEPALPPNWEADDIPFTHLVALTMVEHAAKLGKVTDVAAA